VKISIVAFMRRVEVDCDRTAEAADFRHALSRRDVRLDGTIAVAREFL
jgi:hypothetical protein